MKKNFSIIIITLAGLALRLFRLGYHDLWYDEGASVIFSKYYFLAHNTHLFYTILHFWTKFFGINEFSVRFPAMVFSVISIPIIYMLGKKLLDHKTALIAALIMAISPMQLWYAQEARAYSLVTMLGLISSYFAVLIITKKSRCWLFFILFSIMGLLAGELYILLLVSQIILLSVHAYRKKDKDFIKNIFISILIQRPTVLNQKRKYNPTFN